MQAPSQQSPSVAQLPPAGAQAGWPQTAVHASERATVARSGAGLLVGRAADGVETDEIGAARGVDPAEERAAVGVEVTGGAVAVADGERRAAPGGAEARTAVGGAATGAAVGGAGGDRARARRRQLDVTPAGEGRPREREQRSDPGLWSPASRLRAAARQSPRRRDPQAAGERLQITSCQLSRARSCRRAPRRSPSNRPAPPRARPLRAPRPAPFRSRCAPAPSVPAAASICAAA